MNLFKKILVANRGEIAVRVIRAAQEMGIRAVAIYSAVDKDDLHTRIADEAYSLGENLGLSETYLDIKKILGIAKDTDCEAIHPGYGFLAENPDFVKACNKAGVVFIGPNAKAMKLMGNKIESREALKDAGIPMTAGITGDVKTLLMRAKEIPFPIMIKAAAGGGGKGMRIVYDDSKLEELLESTSREAKSYFGDGTIFIEKYIEDPRHIEIQVLGDNYGNVIHLYERECSIQRRHQKIIEESPSPTLNQKVREKMGETAVRIAKEIGYNNAGTVEFLVDKNLQFYFLEMNTRVQVEHPVTELVTGIDIVQEQILIAAGKELDIDQELVTQNGHAIECRIYAEDPENNFLPSPGKMTYYLEPEGDLIRVDSGILEATTIHSFYDPLISKLIVWGENREEARATMMYALDQYIIHGIRTNISFLNELLQNKAYITNKISTKYCDEHLADITQLMKDKKESIPHYFPVFAYYLHDFACKKLNPETHDINLWDHIGFWRDVMELEGTIDGSSFAFSVEKINGNKYHLTSSTGSHIAQPLFCYNGYLEMILDGKYVECYISASEGGKGFVTHHGQIFEVSRNDVLYGSEALLGSMDSKGHGDGKIVSPMPGKVIKINIKKGAEVTKGATLLIVEAMKMENYIMAPADGIVEKINVKVGDMVDSSMKLVEMKK
jgi:acetyl-CoA carboxylase biotin carboxylase subunit